LYFSFNNKGIGIFIKYEIAYSFIA